MAQKQPNAWRLYDMLGNVTQWTADWYDANYYSQSPSQDPRGPTSGVARVKRGGSWFHTSDSVRVSDRDRADPAKHRFYYGFRCAGEALP